MPTIKKLKTPKETIYKEEETENKQVLDSKNSE